MKAPYKILIVTAIFLLPAALPAQVIDLRGTWKFHIDDKPAWAARDFDDSSWDEMFVPSPWEEEGFHNYDGFAWYRRSFDGRKLDKDENYYLDLGTIDDCDEVYVNGTLIGFSGLMPPKFKTAYNTERKYPLPPQLIRYDGMNTLAVRVYDVVQFGGIVGGRPGIYHKERDKNLLVDLQGMWSFSKSEKGERARDGVWEKIMVPGAWENQGYRRYDGFAWYKRTFTLPANFPKEPVVLMVGKIDDFDKVYLNGELVGTTNDFRRYGESTSYDKHRVYKIPENVLRRGGTNTIEILVEDIGNVGGIYEGVVGITTKSNFDRYFRQGW